MASTYILYSNKLGKYYIGSCLDLAVRIKQHLTREHPDAFTSKSDDWVIFFSIDNLSYDQARKIEKHIKQMKSRAYIERLPKYPEIALKLRERFA